MSRISRRNLLLAAAGGIVSPALLSSSTAQAHDVLPEESPRDSDVIEMTHEWMESHGFEAVRFLLPSNAPEHTFYRKTALGKARDNNVFQISGPPYMDHGPKKTSYPAPAPHEYMIQIAAAWWENFNNWILPIVWEGSIEKSLILCPQRWHAEERLWISAEYGPRPDELFRTWCVPALRAWLRELGWDNGGRR